ncbi:lipid kinase, YegS/Rv2252/BmrU family [Reichenbachiella faecimaris]|uniref:Lipid kinase, YegS/Rv2252/BmrU family n=2 Tax=Reichenbachiella faecimaris TaxID=692418 RepID=A0A1W2G9C3_REIFA|nr:lipid kinase, YegS/Rv2252/BmrU family [Reichenbachiella faecimaris]
MYIMPKQQILFVINPVSGSGKSFDWKSLISDNLDSTRFNYNIRFTQAQGDAIIFTREAVGRGIDIICAVGGDGTINEVAQGLINTSSALAIIPRGSGNGLARHFKIPTDPAKAIKKLSASQLHSIDTGLLNEKLFLCVAGLGFDATVAKAFDQFGKRGLLTYAWLSIRNFFTYRAENYTITLDQKKIITQAFLIAFANASQFGNNAYIAPTASTDDGLLNLVIIKPFPIWSIFGLISKVFNKKIHLSKYCDSYLFQSLKIESPNSIAHIDGEPVDSGQQVQVSVRPNSLNILY